MYRAHSSHPAGSRPMIQQPRSQPPPPGSPGLPPLRRPLAAAPLAPPHLLPSRLHRPRPLCIVQCPEYHSVPGQGPPDRLTAHTSSPPTCTYMGRVPSPTPCPHATPPCTLRAGDSPYCLNTQACPGDEHHLSSRPCLHQTFSLSVSPAVLFQHPSSERAAVLTPTACPMIPSMPSVRRHRGDTIRTRLR